MKKKLWLPHLPDNAITKWLLAAEEEAHVTSTSVKDNYIDYNGDQVKQHLVFTTKHKSHHRNVLTNLEWALKECDERNAKTKERFYHIHYCPGHREYICICKINKDGSHERD